ncbi:dihydrolipoyl dehydrogenase family protein [Halodesulfovibrio marinisediminis]|uniref:Glutathione reductase (NADPH) n=1 Tax=Halodesulfovibrio marinisediminis DSM 17456 TaxID=1121457 RepID=A0A1N6DDU8_9BACT|nr:NAD(P)/FAD-dependent oxidoreductase [Halodesulfovibrio marinisediminis]SIN68887.1 glutathione reductase (NADPH) [Halodesulfovibrio marinisediminis DSM 17456]
MTKVEKPDVFIIGSGPAGGAVARTCVAEGKKVVVADYQPFGGTCPLRGCEPKKFLFDVTNVALRRKHMTERGLRGCLAINWKMMMTAMAEMRDPIPSLVENFYEKHGIIAVHGKAQFASPDTILVNKKKYQPDRIVIAAGATPRPLDFSGNELLMNTDQFFEIRELPSRIVFIGGGFIAFELSHIAAIAGAQVDVILRSERFLRRFDPSLVECMIEASRDMGVRFHTMMPPSSLKKDRDELVLCAGEDNIEFRADCIVHAAGRIAHVAALNPQKGQLELNQKGGINVNEFMQSTSNPRVYAAGDVVGNTMELTPVASMEGMVVSHNILHGNGERPDYSVVPYTLFTHPPLSTVGLQEEEAQAQKIPYKVYEGSAAGWSEYRRIGERYPSYKVLVSKKDDTILGATMNGHNSEEIINIFAFAMRTKTTVAELNKWLWAYPSFGYTIRYMLK